MFCMSVMAGGSGLGLTSRSKTRVKYWCAATRREYAPKVDSQQILSFYMGKNTPERKDYIMENLVVPVEE